MAPFRTWGVGGAALALPAAAAAAAVMMFATACGGANRRANGDVGSPRVERRSYVERTPSGTRTVTVTTTHEVGDAPPPPPRPADAFPGDPLVRYNVERVNAYRARLHRAPLLYDAKISGFALQGSRQLSSDHVPHAHFAAHASGTPGFGSRSAENQGDPRGVPAMGTGEGDATSSGKRQIDTMLQLMFDEGPGGGHYENMMNPKLRRIGIGLFSPGGRLYMTNDFSD